MRKAVHISDQKKARRANPGKDRRQFSRTADSVARPNVRPNPMRGGIRL